MSKLKYFRDVMKLYENVKTKKKSINLLGIDFSHVLVMDYYEKSISHPTNFDVFGTKDFIFFFGSMT